MEKKRLCNFRNPSQYIHFYSKTKLIFKKKLSHSRRPKTLRLWGKILGAEKDYYVAEGDEVQPVGEEEPLPDAEPRGAGVNKYTYFVTSGRKQTHSFLDYIIISILLFRKYCINLLLALDEWVELPLITPKHVVQARRIKHILTGNLGAKIITNPFFDGEERHYVIFVISIILTRIA